MTAIEFIDRLNDVTRPILTDFQVDINKKIISGVYYSNGNISINLHVSNLKENIRKKILEKGAWFILQHFEKYIYCNFDIKKADLIGVSLCLKYEVSDYKMVNRFCYENDYWIVM